MRLIRSLVIATIAGILIGLAVASTTGCDASGYVGAAIGGASFCLFGGLSGAGTYWLARKCCRREKAAEWIGGTAGFLLAPVLLLLLCLWLVPERQSDAAVFVLAGLLAVSIPLGAVAAIFGAGVGQR